MTYRMSDQAPESEMYNYTTVQPEADATPILQLPQAAAEITEQTRRKVIQELPYGHYPAAHNFGAPVEDEGLPGRYWIFGAHKPEDPRTTGIGEITSFT